MSDDPNISRRYRELAREEPPRHLDDAILAASRRDTKARPAPLVVPSGRRRWYFPVAAAAIIVLAVAVTLHVERDERNFEMAEAPVSAPQPAAAPQSEPPAPAAAEKPAGKREMFTPDPKPAPPPAPSAPAELRDLYKAPSAAPAAPAPAPAPAEAENRARAMARADAQPAPAHPPPAPPAWPRPDAEQAQARQEAGRAAATPARAASDRLASAAALQSPEQWLMGIDDLKRQGRHEEAEKQLAEFRKRYPNYRIPEAITEKFEKR
jgi:outer membrane biosynthesis protein TonB